MSKALRSKWLWALVVLAALAIFESRRPVPFSNQPGLAKASSRPVSRDLAAVLPFEDAPAAPQSAVSKPLVTMDGKAQARALAKELAGAGLMQGVRFVESPGELKGETLIIRGKVLESKLGNPKDGKRFYSLGVEISAARPGRPPFWQVVLSRMARSTGRPEAVEIDDLVRGLYAQAADELGGALKRESAAASPAKN
jgi:hypothetical protein